MRYLLPPLLLGLTLLAASCGGGGSGQDATTLPGGDSRAGASPGDWPMLGHDLSSTFHNTDETVLSPDNAAGLSEAWTLTAHVYGVPAVVDGTVYVLSLDGTFALDAETGDEVWHNASANGTSSITYADGVLYAHDFRAGLHALDAATGEELWQAQSSDNQYAAGFSSPIVAGGLVIVGSSSSEETAAVDNATFRGSIVAFDRETGAEVWRHYTVEPPYNGVSMWSTATVDLDAGRVFGTTGNNYTGDASDTSDSIFALDLETGALVWNTQLSEGDVFTIPSPQSDDTDFGTNPLLFEATVDGTSRRLLGAGQKSGMFWVLDRETGDVVWSKQVSGGSALIGGVFNNGAFDGEHIILAGNNAASDAPGGEPASGESEPLGTATTPTSVLMAPDPATGDIVWERQLPAWVWAPITLANGVGFVSAERQFEAFDTKTGEMLFSLQASGTIASGAAISNGRVFFGSGLSYFNTTEGDTFYALTLP
ncbi:MAG: PQQ-binding-like beta-propeller repeat protein [Dehalococcoidia bacterium]